MVDVVFIWFLSFVISYIVDVPTAFSCLFFLEVFMIYRPEQFGGTYVYYSHSEQLSVTPHWFRIVQFIC